MLSYQKQFINFLYKAKMNDLKIINMDNHKFIFKNKRKVPSNDLALSNGSNTILPFINSYDQSNSRSLNEYWSNKLNHSKGKEANQYGEISPPKKPKPVSTSAVKNLQENSILIGQSGGSPPRFNFPKIKVLNDKKNSRNRKDNKGFIKKESKEDSVNFSNNEEQKKMTDTKENQSIGLQSKNDSDMELVKKWLIRKEGEKKKEKINNNSNNGRTSFTDNEAKKVVTKKPFSSKKALIPIDESICYLKNIINNGEFDVSSRKKSFNIPSISTSENKNINAYKKKDSLEPIKVLSCSKNSTKEREEKAKLPPKPLNIKIKKSIVLNASKEKNIAITKSTEIVRSNNNLKINFGSKSKNGLNKNGNKKINQDSFLIKTSILNMKDYSLFGVFDGHGTSGHLISNTVKDSLAESLSKPEFYNIEFDINYSKLYTKLTSNSYSLIKSTFSKLDEEITKTKIDVKYSGSTANFIIILERRLLCVNCGDSRAILIQKTEDKNKISILRNSNESNDYDWYTIALSKDHKPDVEDEKNRIINSNGRIDRYKDNQGPYRVWLKNEDTPGLAMSRSLGDSLAKTVGVISEPEIYECEITDNSLFVVIASDGIWEFLTNEEVSRIVMPYYIKNDINGAVNTLVEEAEQIWREEEDVIDDITALIIFFHK